MKTLFRGAAALTTLALSGLPALAAETAHPPRPAPARTTYKAEIVEVAAHDERGHLVRSPLDLQVEQKLPSFAACFAAAKQRGELRMDYGWTEWQIALRRDGSLHPSGSSGGDESPALLKCFLSVLPRLMSKAEVERTLVPHDRPFREIELSVKLRFRPAS